MQTKKTLRILVVMVPADLQSPPFSFGGSSAQHSASQQRLTVEEGIRKQVEKMTSMSVAVDQQSRVISILNRYSTTYIEDSKSPNERRVELALIRGTSKSQLVRGDIEIRFQFDEFGRLLNYSIREVFIGP